MDPVISATLRGALGLLFLSAALHKLAAPGAFRAALVEYRLLPGSTTAAASWALVALEIAAAGALVAPATVRLGVALATGLLVIYTAAIAVNLARGRRDLDCGCAGPAHRQPIGVGLIVRNAVLAGAALLCLVPLRARSLSWLDGLTIVAGVGTAAALYAAIQRLMATAPVLARLRQDA
jgi:Methylamine utilisation protein MauE